MLKNNNVIYVGAKPDFEKNHAGGQSSASQGLIEYAKKHEINLNIIDSAQERAFHHLLYFKECQKLVQEYLS